jgi:hypothetical protein
MNELDRALYKTRKTLLDVCRDLGLEYVLDSRESQTGLTLDQCNSCGIWLRPAQLIPDQDGLPICRDCLNTYGL